MTESVLSWLDRKQPQWLENLRLGAPLIVGPTGQFGLLLAPSHVWSPEMAFVQLISKIDESGTHGADYMVMAGYSARLNQWNRFDHKWNKALRKAGLDYFHTKEHLHHPFAQKVTEIVDKHLLFGFVVRMDLADYKQVYRNGEWGGKAQPDSFYGLCFRYCMAFVVEQARVEMPEGFTLNFVIEEGHKNEGAPAEIIRQTKQKKIPDLSEYLGTAVPGPKLKTPGLQAADSLATSAWQTELFGLTKSDVSQPTPVSALNPQTMMNCPVFYTHPDAAELAQFRDDYFAHIKARREFGRRKTA